MTPAAWPWIGAALGSGAGALAGFMVTLDVSTVKLTAVMLSLIVLPLMVIHVELGGLAFLALLWTRVSDVAVATHGAPSIAAPFGLLLILASLTRRIAAGERIGLADLSPFLPVAPYLAVVLGSVLWSEWPDRALDSGIATLKDILVFWILVETLRGPAALRRAIFTLVLAGGVLAGLNLHQYLTDNFLSDYGGFAQSEVLNIVGQLDANRLGGPLNSPNFFALVLAVLVPLGLATLRIRQPFVSRVAVVLALVTIVLTVLLTFSRGAALVLMLVLGLSAIRHRIGVSHLALVGAGLVVVAALAPPTVWERIETLAEPVASGSRETGEIVDTSVELRLGAQQTALEIFLAHPFVGAGSANFPPLYREVSRQIGVKAVGTEYFPHNLYLEILAELGVVGLAAFAVMVYALWAGLRRSRPLASAAGGPAHAVRELSFGIEAALVGYLAGMMLLQSSYPRYFWMLLALVVVATRASRDVATRRHAPPGARSEAPPRPAGAITGAAPQIGLRGLGEAEQGPRAATERRCVVVVTDLARLSAYEVALREAGVSAGLTLDLDEAQRWLGVQRPDVLVLDQDLPRLARLRLCGLVRGDEDAPVQVVFIGSEGEAGPNDLHLPSAESPSDVAAQVSALVALARPSSPGLPVSAPPGPVTTVGGRGAEQQPPAIQRPEAQIDCPDRPLDPPDRLVRPDLVVPGRLRQANRPGLALGALDPGRTTHRQENQTVATTLLRAHSGSRRMSQRPLRGQPIPSPLSVSRIVSSLIRSTVSPRSTLTSAARSGIRKLLGSPMAHGLWSNARSRSARTGSIAARTVSGQHEPRRKAAMARAWSAGAASRTDRSSEPGRRANAVSRAPIVSQRPEEDCGPPPEEDAASPTHPFSGLS